ncbi:MAG: TolC family protein [Lentimonas sp.]
MLPRFFSLLCLSSTCLFAEAAETVTPAPAEVLPLNEAIEVALANNLGLIAKRYAPANAQDSVISEEAAFDPSLFSSASFSERQSAAASSSLDSTSTPESGTRRARTGVDKRLSTGASITVDTDISRSSSNNNAARNPDYGSNVGLSIRQPLMKDAWARVNLAPLARAKVSAEQSIFELRSDILDVITETEIAYWNLAFTIAGRELIASSLELAETLLEETRERERLGLITKIDILQAETELVTQQEDIIQAERAIEDAQDELRRLMGDQSFLNPIEDDIAVRTLPEQMSPLGEMQSIIAATIRTDAEAAVQERALEVARINAMLAQDEMRPDLDLVAGLDYSGRDEDGETAYRGAYNADGYGWNVGMELRLPWGFRDAQARKRQADRSVERATVQLYDIKQQKALAARNAWRAVNSGLKRIEVTQKSMRLNEDSFDQVRARYGSGVVAYRQVLEAQRDYDTARRNHLRAIIETLRAQVRLSRIDGTVLSRNNYDWSLAKKLALEPDLETHAQGDAILNPDS